MEFMKKVEKISRKIGETATDTYNVVVCKSGKIIEGTKSKISISDKEDKIDEKYTDIGRTVYDMYKKGEDVGEVFEKEAKEIDALKNEIEEIKRKILLNKGLKECHQCGKAISIENNYCEHCGAKQEKEVTVVNTTDESKESTEKVCSNCQAICDTDSEFCPNCGNKFEN